ncbi:SMP-30/gluconolactonase/LRE family protein [Actinoalloteichus hymeniacidonis]|uniref:Gluconolactonase n=1 Tax=Actinoalloteichus hymeniacidonis TaxID=340345 RepID=A0AAC9HLY6_9PSEU|nr:SMP-30/gluconolactonase/LRE family protein [Actinoalloteichus hymeniacidonis]AOS61630.1 gluconolactonase [Actinoalloteichus hymeniacidonis]MBB5910358.1 sugar lactone lactonase YvrE [Actinoalloteichus hymeniacidonis]
MKATTVTTALTHHGEGPVWNPQRGVLHWVDMLAGAFLTSDPSFRDVTRTEVGEVAAVVRPATDGGLVVAVERGFAVIPPGSDEPQRLTEVWSDPSIRMNEGGCDPQGRFYVGSMAYGATPDRGKLFRLDPDGSVTVVLEPVTISNGLNWSLDGEIAYYIDTPTGRVDAFDFDATAGALRNRRPLVEIDSKHGSPDGMAIDAEGRLWVALWGGSAVHCYSPNGTLEEVVDVPVRQVTACAFGGDGLDTLYITTSRDGLSDPEAEAGALFSVTPGVTGVPVLPFAGSTARG